jgi:REP element-mobilizing transposase RayT
MKKFAREFGGKLYHDVPGWVPVDAVFHLRIRCAPDNPHPLTDAWLAPKLLDGARRYAAAGRWHVLSFLLMPDHLHALVCFPPEELMTRVVADWKRYHARVHGIRWQPGYFDHRVRPGEQLALKHGYIVNNPVAKGLCVHADDWPHRYDAPPEHWPV